MPWEKTSARKDATVGTIIGTVIMIPDERLSRIDKEKP